MQIKKMNTKKLNKKWKRWKMEKYINYKKKWKMNNLHLREKWKVRKNIKSIKIIINNLSKRECGVPWNCKMTYPG